MANRRMMSKSIVDTDYFMSMPPTTRLLYYELNWRADDDGFVDKPKSIQKMVGCSDDDYRLLIAKRYIIEFESGVCVIRHWFIHNQIRTDRYTETKYQIEKSSLRQQKTDVGRYYDIDRNAQVGMTEWQQPSPIPIPNTISKTDINNNIIIEEKEIYKEKENTEMHEKSDINAQENAQIDIEKGTDCAKIDINNAQIDMTLSGISKKNSTNKYNKYIIELFDKTWGYVINKKNKEFAKNTYIKKMKKCKTEESITIKARYILKNYIKSRKEWEEEGTEKQYIPMFSSWLNKNIEDGVINEEDL